MVRGSGEQGGRERAVKESEWRGGRVRVVRRESESSEEGGSGGVGE